MASQEQIIASATKAARTAYTHRCPYPLMSDAADLWHSTFRDAYGPDQATIAALPELMQAALAGDVGRVTGAANLLLNEGETFEMIEDAALMESAGYLGTFVDGEANAVAIFTQQGRRKDVLVQPGVEETLEMNLASGVSEKVAGEIMAHTEDPETPGDEG